MLKLHPNLDDDNDDRDSLVHAFLLVAATTVSE